MKKLALALMAAAAAVFGFGIVASAQTYSPAASVPVAPGPGSSYSVTYTNCVVGETITFNQAQSTPATVTGLCTGTSAPALNGSILGLLLPQQTANGTATGTFTAAPTAPGTYTGTGTGVNGTVTFSFTIPGQAATTTTGVPVTTAAPSGQIPATGSSGISTTTTVAIGLLVVGAGLLVVAQVRRRQAPHTA